MYRLLLILFIAPFTYGDYILKDTGSGADVGLFTETSTFAKYLAASTNVDTGTWIVEDSGGNLSVIQSKDVLTEAYSVNANENGSTALYEELFKQKYPQLQGGVGPQGPPGLDGVDGLDGLDGLDGAQGPPGIDGPQGLQGIQGIQGIQGLNGDGIPGEQGEQGIQGEIGPEGPQGEPGIQGLDGAQGVQGPPGLDGAIGPRGDKGLTGERGPMGATGSRGQQGIAGPRGLTGSTGLKGDKGDKGDPGTLVQSDWNASSGNSYIKNRPIISSGVQIYNSQFHYDQAKLMKYSGDRIKFDFRGTNVLFYYNGDVGVGNPNTGTINAFTVLTSPQDFTILVPSTKTSAFTTSLTVPPGAIVIVGNFLDDSKFEAKKITLDVLSIRSGQLATSMPRATFDIMITKKDSSGQYWMHIIERMY